MDALFREIFKDELAAAYARGYAQGVKESMIKSIRAVMKNLNFTAAQAMDALGVPADKQKEYVDLI